MRMFLEHSSEFAAFGRFAQDVVWEKHNGSGLHADRFRRVHESACQFYRGGWADLYKLPPIVEVEEAVRGKTVRHASKPAHFRSRDHRTAYAYDGTRLQRSIIPVRSCHGTAVHETQKPEGIVRPLLLYSVPPGGSVFVPFAGSGTELIVARDLGLKAVGCESDPAICATAARRLGQAVLSLS
jgi:site-specific DNA-methyltransferase (adenine-specific)